MDKKNFILACHGALGGDQGEDQCVKFCKIYFKLLVIPDIKIHFLKISIKEN